MPDYHPLDVRYKGPSTAYRGSARRKKDHVRAETPPPNQSLTKAVTPPPTQSPWGPTVGLPPRAEDIVRAAVGDTRVAARGPIALFIDMIIGLFRTMRYIYIGIVLLAFLFFTFVVG